MAKVENEKAVAILSYFIVGLIWYLADEKMKKSSLAKYHFKQALVLLLVSIAFSIVTSILTVVTLGLFGIIALIVNLLIFVLWLIGLINAINGKEKPIPIIGGIAKNFKF